MITNRRHVKQLKDDCPREDTCQGPFPNRNNKKRTLIPSHIRFVGVISHLLNKLKEKNRRLNGHWRGFHFTVHLFCVFQLRANSL